MMNYRQKIPDSCSPRCVYPKKISGSRKYRWLIHHHPMFYPIAKVRCTNCCIVLEPFNNIPVRPSAFYFKDLRQVPVINGKPGLYPLFKTVVNYIIIVIYTGLVYFAGTVWQDACP